MGRESTVASASVNPRAGGRAGQAEGGGARDGRVRGGRDGEAPCDRACTNKIRARGVLVRAIGITVARGASAGAGSKPARPALASRGAKGPEPLNSVATARVHRASSRPGPRHVLAVPRRRALTHEARRCARGSFVGRAVRLRLDAGRDVLARSVDPYLGADARTTHRARPGGASHAHDKLYVPQRTRECARGGLRAAREGGTHPRHPRSSPSIGLRPQHAVSVFRTTH